MEAFSAILKRQLQLTVQTLGQAVRTPSGILIITFYSNIGLGRNQLRWKANKILCKLTIWMANKILQTAPVRMEKFGIRTALRKIPELLFGQGKSCPSGRPRLPSGRTCLRLRF